jgi:hypothetical protein
VGNALAACGGEGPASRGSTPWLQVHRVVDVQAGTGRVASRPHLSASNPSPTKVVVSLDVARYGATASWPDDVIGGREPSVAGDFEADTSCPYVTVARWRIRLWNRASATTRNSPSAGSARREGASRRWTLSSGRPRWVEPVTDRARRVRGALRPYGQRSGGLSSSA